ncbi:hypothetical protein IscW_ISCW006537, partial [Ixodes scapularis]
LPPPGRLPRHRPEARTPPRKRRRRKSPRRRTTTWDSVSSTEEGNVTRVNKTTVKQP